MSKPAPTLIDTLYRLTFDKQPIQGWQGNAKMRHALEAAHTHRFIVNDDRTAAFMAELANEAFIKYAGTAITFRIADSLRVSSRLPYPTIWIEYPLRAYQRRAKELRSTDADVNPTEVPAREGWLLQQHPMIDTAIMLNIFTESDVPDNQGYTLWTYPFTYGWCCDDSPLPWRLEDAGQPPDVEEANLRDLMCVQAVGLVGYKRDNVGIVRSPLIDGPNTNPRLFDAYKALLNEWAGVVRRVWALLATIDHLPLSYGQVRQSKGFLARGRIRKYLDHQTITLNVPAKKDTRVLARQMIAMAHRKRHEVRGHWRDDWRNPPSKRCQPHLWVSTDDEADHIVCELCRGRQIYVHMHERGDAALGYVTHDYRVKHEVADG
jgi:hypothetical protein